MLKVTITLHYSLLSFVTWAVSSIAAPADPTITSPAILPRQADAAFVGWISYNGTWTSAECNSGLTWFQEGNYAQCCPDNVARCDAPTACVSGSQIYPFATTTITTACTENYNNKSASICNTAFIYESFGDSSPKTDIVCGDSSVNWSYYRKIPSTATETPTSQSSSLPPAQTQSPQDHKSSSKLWIVGVVVGPIAGIALVATIIFFVLRRSRQYDAQQPYSSQTAVATTTSAPPAENPPFNDAKPQMTQSTSAYLGQHSPGLNGSFHSQGWPSTPAPQYNSAPGSPPPPGMFPADAKLYHAPLSPVDMPDAAELGGVSAVAAPSSSTGQTFTAELPGGHTR